MQSHTHMLILQCIQTNESTMCSYENIQVIYYLIFTNQLLRGFCLFVGKSIDFDSGSVCVCVYFCSANQKSFRFACHNAHSLLLKWKKHIAAVDHITYFTLLWWTDSDNYNEWMRIYCENRVSLQIYTNFAYEILKKLFVFRFFNFTFSVYLWFECLSMCVYARAYFSQYSFFFLSFISIIFGKHSLFVPKLYDILYIFFNFLNF